MSLPAKFVGFVILFIGHVLSSLTLSAELEPADSPAADVPSLVQEYLGTTDGEHAAVLLAEIVRHPQADLVTVEAAIRMEPMRPMQPVGLQPSMPVRVRERAFHYGLYVPASYNPAKAYALIICLHGAGFTGDAYLERWQTRLGDQYILACPTSPQGAWWTREAAELILATMRDVQTRYHVDPDRIFLTGMSNGGIGVYLIGSHYAPLFAGLAPMAGGLDDVLFPFLQNLRHTPVYLIHGTHDQVMPAELSRSIAKELARLGYPYTYREHERTHPVAGGHYFPREELPELVAWFDSHRRNPLPHNLTVVRDATHLIPFSWVRIDAADRIAAFSDLLIDSHDEALTDRRYAKLDAEITAPNRIVVTTKHVRRYSLFLNDALVDVSQPLTVVNNGKTVYEGRLNPQVDTMLREARVRHDRHVLYPIVLPIQVGE
ncbi:MAG TPA: hypothetical protein VJ692_12930 [Nitrospiraceae bacterium]|nr:hypothetical protein [Nitrospiraceae bacterium]